ncbi:hypothetical protein TanjilG_27407 [Lupinus angustifolius]|uniref:Pentatricopeptide repeat-containing protein n=1 Tax=Lupinus angustifolius TaxID=3871 RepID=A0A1J7GUE0_LUPAN|nr:PREDICTED: pentatricopeptide repeat-containing protein At1g59720, chloroplastic/mitochondrial-like [Lupinus angustifolius]OIV93228.1 hypothetical protein TanjilG_27407 [Lupinus angustifolius]
MSPKDAAFWKAEGTVMNLFKRCSTMRHLKELHGHIIHTNFHQNNLVLGKIVLFCALSGNMNYAVSIFDRIQNPDSFLWNTMIRGFGNINQTQKAIHFYHMMKNADKDSFTFTFLLKIVRSITLGKQLHCNILQLGLTNHTYVSNSLIHMYGMLNDIETAHQLFEEMQHNAAADLVAWNSIIHCHVYCRSYTEALNLFTRMLQRQVQPDDATLVVILSACGAIGALDFGRWIHSSFCMHQQEITTSVSNSFVDMYAKCGAMEEAYQIFSKMRSRKNIVSWNVMILGLASHGNGEEALALFREMLKENVERPNDVTFLGVLCACSHGGMVDEGRKYFDIMIREYNIQPTMKHYGCMVDLFGRAGLLDEGYRLIKEMPVECVNAIVWRTLLAACRIHGNVELGEKVRKHVLELEPDHSSDYVLLANMYASTGRWNEMSKERRSMQERGIQKPEPGNSSFINREILM